MHEYPQIGRRTRSCARVLLAAVAASLWLAPLASARPPADLEKFREGRLAIEAGNCDRAVEVLESVTTQRRSSARWVELAAEAYTCSGRLTSALEYWRQLDERLDPNPARTRQIAALEVREREQRGNREHDLLARLAGGRTTMGPGGLGAQPPASISREPVTGAWREARSTPSSGRYGETYTQKLRLQIERGRAELRGHVFVEFEQRDEKYQDGAVHWYEIEATGVVRASGVEFEGRCTAKVWSFDRAGVVAGDSRPLRGSFVRTSDRDVLRFEPAMPGRTACGTGLGELEPAHP